MSELYIGVMSGTSLDGIDVVLVDLSNNAPLPMGQLIHPIPQAVHQRLSDLCVPRTELLHSKDPIDQLGELDTELGLLFAQAVVALLNQTRTPASEIKAIGCHGQTIAHRPDSEHPFTIQIGDPNVIAQRTGIVTVADFRRRDIAAGGQGAPLVPLFHQILFQQPDQNRIILNLGGIANITWLPKNKDLILAYDTGPGNALMNDWCQQHLNQQFDRDGAWATQGQVDEDLLNALLSEPYFDRHPPKSTGRDLFSLAWLQNHLRSHGNLKPEDVQRTLLELTARTVAHQVQRLTDRTNSSQVIACGGGRHNQALMKQIQLHVGTEHQVLASDQLGVDGDYVEAMAFAWLAKQRIENRPGNLPSATGAKSAVTLGAIY